ncbi:FecR family protein [Sunxiuqinia sp. A32]|uniref:FecR family protein n=1 Tax=Sunxiuqinia sp. A32 TaxID=3461496 RepID=UPI0040458D53
MSLRNLSIKKLVAYLNGELSGKEADEITTCFNQSDVSKKELDHYEILWNLSERLDQMEKIDKLKARGKINSRIEESENKWKIYLSYFQRAAAILILPALILSAYLLYFNFEKGRSVGQEFVASYGTRSTVMLPDGSVVWLNSGSKLKYGPDFNHSKRTVFLDGEAFFDVVANKSRPFDVVTNQYTIRAVGTQFNVFASADDEFETTLEEGAIQLFQVGLSDNLPVLKMDPGQRALFDHGKLIVSDVDVRQFSAWREGKLIFKDTPMKEVVSKLERWYNVDIELKNPELLKYRFTAIFRNETIQQALDMLCFSSPLKYNIFPGKRQKDDTVAKVRIEINVKYKL